MRVSDKNFITIQGWMRTELNLSGNDLLVYAIIYGITQDEESEFYGSQEYMAEWCGCTTRSIRNALDSLLTKGLLKIIDRPVGNTVHYQALRTPVIEGVGTKFQGGRKIFPTGVENISDNNIEYSKEDKNTIPKGIVRENPTEETSSDNVSDYERHMYTYSDERPKKKKSRWDNCAEMVDEYTEDEELRCLLKAYLSDRLAMKDKPIYANQWKSLLKKLTAIGGNTKAVVQQSIEYGYASFYPVHANRQNRMTSTPLSNFGESEVNQTVKVTKEQREEMLKNGEVY